MPFFYIHLGSTYNKVGIVCLTTYMVVALSRYAYPPEGETIAATVWYVDYQETRKKKENYSLTIILQETYHYIDCGNMCGTSPKLVSK